MAGKLKASEKVDAEMSESEVPADEEDASLGALKCGSSLHASRTTQGLSIQAVAKQLRLSSTQIEALEQDDFAALPEPTIVKGFIRNYAKLLKIPAEPILAAYAEMMPDKEQYAFSLKPGINMKITEKAKPGGSHYLILTVLFLLGLGCWFFYQNFIQKPDTLNSVPRAVEMLPEALDLQAPATTELASPVVADAVENSATNNTPVASADTTTTTSALEEGVAEGDANTSDTDNVAVNDAPAADARRLVFNATQETWISIVNTSGKEVYNKILYEGNRDVVDVVQPSQVVVGNAHGVTLAVDGKSIDLAPYTRINVARIPLDE